MGRLRCIKCGGIMKGPTEITRRTQTCGGCRGTHGTPARRPRDTSGAEAY